MRRRCRLIASDRARLAGVGGTGTLGQKAGVSEPFGNEVESDAVDGQAGHEAEGSSVLQFLLMHGDEKEVVAVENEAGEVITGQVGGPGRETEGSFTARAEFAFDWDSAEKGLHLVVEFDAFHFEGGGAFAVGDGVQRGLV